jgi:hypothetical protein
MTLDGLDIERIRSQNDVDLKPVSYAVRSRNQTPDSRARIGSFDRPDGDTAVIIEVEHQLRKEHVEIQYGSLR